MKKVMIVIGISAFVCISLVCKKSISSEQDEGQWTTYTTSDGLPSDEVGAIAFDPDGDLWCVPLVEGGIGVGHFDGNTWKQYTTKDGLGSNTIIWMENTLAVSSDGVLWVATFGGVARFDGKAWTTYTVNDGLLANKVAAVAIAPNGDLWCAHPAPFCGISHFDGKTWTAYTTKELGLTFCNLLNVVFAPDSTLWAGGSNFVLRYHGETWTSFSSETGAELPIALSMDIGSDGKIWISGGGGVSCYDDSIWKYYSFIEIGAKGSGEEVEAVPLAVDTENVLWVGVPGEGIFRYDGKSWNKFSAKGGPALNNVYSITVGPDGALWFGTKSGISRYQPSDRN